MAEKQTLHQLLNVLKASGADAWEVTDTQEKGWEFYLIRHELDQNRFKELESYQVKVYKKFDDCLGSAAAPVPADADEAEMKRIVAGLCQDAAYVRNPFYTLNQPEAESGAEPAAAPVDLKAISGDFLRTVSALPETETEDLNSCEIFVSEIRKRILNSEGIDVIVTCPSSMVEAVVNARKDGHEIELYRMYTCGTCDSGQLTRDLAETMRFGRDRLVTEPTPALGKADLILSTDAACSVYEYFADHLAAGMVYRGISDWKPGDTVAPAEMTVKTAAFLPNSSQNGAYDSEGARIRDVTLIDAGKAVRYWGSRQFSRYLGLEDSFLANNFIVSGGTASAEELREGSWLEVVEFSDFEVDDVTGDIAGEIRLGYLHRDGKTVPVSGGSVSGSMDELAKKMRFSAEQRQYDTFLIPALTRLNGVTVTGAV